MTDLRCINRLFTQTVSHPLKERSNPCVNMLKSSLKTEVAGFRETLPRPVLPFVLDFAVFALCLTS